MSTTVMGLNIHRILYLYKTPEKFYIQPIQEPNEAITIDRYTYEVSLNCTFSPSSLPSGSNSTLIYGIVGIKKLLNSACLIVITDASDLGVVDGHEIFRVGRTQIIPIDVNSSRSDQTSISDWNQTYLSMLESVLQTASFYFSYSYDLTNSLQRNHSVRNNNLSTRVDYYDRRFFWNEHLSWDLLQYGQTAYRYILPIIHGFVSINSLPLGFEELNWTLISRRSVRRAGTRFNRRGIDRDGNVANFVETEQILEDNKGTMASHVQIRGSIPLLWSQKPTYQYKPPIVIESNYSHQVPIKKHFDELMSVYASVSVVNLIDHKGHEGQLEREFSHQMQDLQKHYGAPYHYFDFHKECGKSRWSNLWKLIDSIRNEISSHSYFLSSNGEMIQIQVGVIRTNCIDSLDRTNVVQSMIAGCVLDNQIRQFNLNWRAKSIQENPQVMCILKNVWADNADALSIQYAGTPALKTDFTRTGKRTKVGLAKDGVNSLSRYFSNTFLDSYRQDAIDLFLGNFDGYPSPLYRPLDLTSYSSQIQVTFIIITIIALYFYLRLPNSS